MSALKDLLQRLRQTIGEIDADTAASELEAARPPVLLDVRELDEWATGHAPGAVHVSRGLLEMRIDAVVPDRDRRIVVYCAAGNRSLLAAEALQRLGYRDVVSLAGGLESWKQAGRPIHQPTVLDDESRRRYARHLSIPEVGAEGQARLLAATAVLVGAGGLGSPAALYLAAAGVGTLRVIDADVVDETNLQRQVLHDTRQLGRAKVESARDRLASLNPGVRVTTWEERLTSANVEDVFGGADVVVDGCDNFPTRYLVNDACVKLGIPNVHGSVYRFEGQATVFCPPRGPCYRCLFPEPPPPELAPSCAEAGVLGILPGVIGLLEAVEALKLLLGVGRPLVGRLLHYDALEQDFTEFAVHRRPECTHCGDGVSFPGYVDYEQFCASSSG